MRIPTATYRVQLTPEFPMRAARDILPYLARLGVSDLYVSPILEARAGSTHGYDVVDPRSVRRELGGREALEELLGEIARLGLGLLLDIVPNHMAFDGANPLLADVLENGPDSRYFGFFDVDWNHPYESMKGRLLAPFLGDFYGICLERGDLRLAYDREGLAVRYHALRLPLRVDSYDLVLAHRQRELARQLGKDHPDYLKYLGLMYVLRHLPPGAEAQERNDQIAFAKSMLWELYSGNPGIRRHLDDTLTSFNGRPEEPPSYNALDELLGRQHFRLAYWKVGTEELNYRRFFSINELICLRVEEEEVFQRTHALVLELARTRSEVGLRVDHVDGLYDPSLYLRRLRAQLPDSYLVVEKILDLGERLPESWPVQGTTGYDFLNLANGLFCSRRNRLSINRIYRRFAGREVSFPLLVTEKKRLIAEKHMVGDIDNLAHQLKGLASRYRYGSDYTLYGFRRALNELLVQFPRYRTYITPGNEAEPGVIAEAIRRAKQAIPDFVHELDFVEKIFRLRFEEHLPPEAQREWYRFIQRFQQFTGPLQAKGLEDTALYVYHRLLSLNEVGGNPEKFGISMIEFHHFNRRRAHGWPHALNASSTHDTKRGEDARARLNVLSEIPHEWEQQAGLWRRLARRHKSPPGAPDSNDEYFLYQTLLGAWPFRAAEVPGFRERLKGYLVKAVREAKVHTTWLAPDQGYEEGTTGFADRLLEDAGFLERFLPFQRKVAWYGLLNSLSQTLLKMCSPGIPDFYQGSELWDLSLADPDNRRPVDYSVREGMLARIEKAESAGTAQLGRLIQELFASPEDGSLKILLIHRVLSARAREKPLFDGGAYLPLAVEGERQRHLVSFARVFRGRMAVAAAPRFFTALAGEGQLPLGEPVWGDTGVRLPDSWPGATPAAGPPPAGWVDAVTGTAFPGGAVLMARDLFAGYPGALLLPAGPPTAGG
jgi:(1->4)-alpha-D-glucan 1-alpha-D-glucosylmutase